MSLGYFTSSSATTADLKRHAHAVRQAIDNMPPKERRKRMTSRIIARAEDGSPLSVAYDQARLAPRDRHRLAWSLRR